MDVAQAGDAVYKAVIGAGVLEVVIDDVGAPAGTIYGVSGFQLSFGSEDVNTPGDLPDVLVAMNPAALKKNLKELKRGGALIVNSDALIRRISNLLIMIQILWRMIP